MGKIRLIVTTGILFLLTSNLFGQQYIITGTILNSETKSPLPGATVILEKTSLGTTSNKDGKFKIKVKKKKEFSLFISFLGYESNTLTFSESKLKQLGTDTIKLQVLLRQKAVEIPIIEISSEQAPDTIYGSYQYHVSDYELLENDQFLFLVYEKKVNKYARLVTTDLDHKVIADFIIPNGAEELFRDAEQNINVISKNEVQRVIFQSGKISLHSIPKDDFDRLIKPCIDTIGERVLFSDHQWYYPEFSYYMYNKADSSNKPIMHIVDKHLKELFRSEYKYLTPRQKLEARKIEWKTGMDKIDAAALFISNFQNDFYFKSLYAPAFILNDTIMVFDHYSDYLYKFNVESELVDSIPIQYHKSKELKWKEKLIKDEVTDEVYSLYEKNGNHFLQKVDTQSGQTRYSFKLTYRYIENIKIKNGSAYYIYRPFESIQKKYLYRESIN